jgi:hypothetical protein
MWKEIYDYEVNEEGEIRKKNGLILKGRTQTNGYIQVGQKRHLLHRLVALAFLPNPLNLSDVDHINCIRNDNRLDNLRWVTRSQNCQNQSIAKNNKSGVKGVSWYKPSKKWMAHIHLDYKQYNLGYYETIEEASEVRSVKALELFTHHHQLHL